MSSPKTAILIGAGDRGHIYASYALANPAKLKIVAVADPVKERRERIAERHGLDRSMVFQGWEEILTPSKMADGAIIATQDTMHVDPAVMALEKGYHVLLEKPMALTLDHCKTIVDSSRRTGKTLNICHVLRYIDFFRKVKEIIDSDIIGDVLTIYHAENVSYYHMAHSYVRGNWHRSDIASPMILAKCCHDLDLIQWFAGSQPRYISSMGNLSHFKSNNAPRGAPARCTDGCPAADTCQYEAVSTYLYGKHMKLGIARTDAKILPVLAGFMLKFPNLSRYIPGLAGYHVWKMWPTSTITGNLTEEGIMKALREGPYGKCVYHNDNDQVDHQETIIEFDSGATEVMKKHGHSQQEGRTLRVDGSLGTIRGKFGGGGRLEAHIHATGEKITYPVKTDLIGHSEGDYGIMENFVNVLNGKEGLTDAEESLSSHLMAFAAHDARVHRSVVKL